MSPQRIQLSRKKGWRKPEGAIVVSRPSKWGNPFQMVWSDCRLGGMCWTVRRDGHVIQDHLNSQDAARRWAVHLFRKYMFRQMDLTPLRGHDLACWCRPDQPCHADVLIELANRGISHD